MIILSYDCGNINLGVCCIDYNENWQTEFCEALSPANLADDPVKAGENAYLIFLRAFRIIYIDNIDMLGGRKLRDTTNIERAVALRRTVAIINAQIPDPALVLIEYQMGPNDKSRGVSYQLMYEYGERSREMRPVYKNQVNFGAGDIGKYQVKYSTNEAANKAHAKDTLLHYLKYVDIGIEIPKRKLSDMADAFLQAVAYCLKNC
jgi:hypothetical protein